MTEALAQNKLLRCKIEQLVQRILELENKSTSKNSSMPPSKDITKSSKNRSLRKKSGKKPGGQKGHKGHHLQMVENPDYIEDHKLTQCPSCTVSLEQANHQYINSKQLFDLPVIKMEVTEHRQYQVTCPCCKEEHTSRLPSIFGKAKTVYGPVTTQLVSYLNVRQYIPFQRLAEMFKVMFNQSISQGTLVNMVNRQANKSEKVYDKIKEYIGLSSIVGADESGCNVNGKNRWFWVFQTAVLNFITVSVSRGFKVIEDLFPQGFPKSTMVTDCWAAQLKTKSKAKQICLAHLQRNYNKLIDQHKSRWAREINTVIANIFAECSKKRITQHAKQDIEKRLDQLISRPLTKSHPNIRALKKRLIKNRSYITTCLYNRKVPPDNNGSERAIRNIKVKEKVSGGFRTMVGAKNYSILRSIIDSAIKQGISPLTAINNPQLVLNIPE